MALPNKRRKIFDGRYEVLGIVGRGSDSVVYHAKHASSPTQEVALKVLLNQKDRPNVADRLRKEALTLVSCRHKFVVRLDDFHSVGDLCYLSMEYAREGDLRKYATKCGGKIDPHQAEQFLRQALEALDFVHKTGVIHRDMKPDNILVMDDAEIRLADFGIALLPGDEPSIEELQKGVGSFGYMPPETLEGVRYDARSDLYALGLTFYEVITGTHPFEKTPLAMQLEAREDKNLTPLNEFVADASARMNETIMGLISFEASDRIQSASDALKSLDGTLDKNSRLARQSDNATRHAYRPGDQTFGLDDPFGAPQNVDEPGDESADRTDRFDIGPDERERSAQPTEKLSSQEVKQIIASAQSNRAENQAGNQEGNLARVEEPSPAEPETPEFAPKPKAPSFEPKPLQSKQTLREKPKQSQIAKQPSRVTVTHESGIRERFAELLEAVPRQFRPLVVALGVAIAVVLAFVVVGKLMQLVTSSSSTDESTVEERSVDSKGSPLGPVDSEDLSFPNLPAGIYSGEIEGVLPGVTSPLTLVSVPNKGLVAVIIGIEGWSPVMVPVEEPQGDAPSVLSVRSNGLIVNMSGEPADNSIEGSFTNVVTGDTGRWTVHPVR